jgi:hypothetical protein
MRRKVEAPLLITVRMRLDQQTHDYFFRRAAKNIRKMSDEFRIALRTHMLQEQIAAKGMKK